MSQHYFKTQNEIGSLNILIGWDKPMQGYFMVIDYEKSLSDQPLFSNLTLDIPYPKSLTSYLVILEEHGIKIPYQLIEEVKLDGEENIGNRFVEHVYINGLYQKKIIAPKTVLNIEHQCISYKEYYYE
jgi:hypothetical protein